MNRSKIKCGLALCFLFGLISYGAPSPQRAKQVIPEQFLREYDPITVFFPRNHELIPGTALDRPPEWLQIQPGHPGTWEVVDRKTVQFSPTIPWPPLSRISLVIHGETHSLATLMDAPNKVFPVPGSRNLDPFRDVGFVFDREIPIDALAKMLTLEVRPLPGLDANQAIWMTSADFSIKELAREHPKDSTGILVTLNQEIPFEKKVIVHLGLSLDRSLTDSEMTYSFETRPLFRLIAFGAGKNVFPVNVNGGATPAEQAMSLGFESHPLFLEFNAPLEEVHLTQIKNMVRFQPVVDDLSFEISGKRIILHFSVKPDAAYQLTLAHENLRDRKGRTLAPFGDTSAFFFMPKASPLVRWRQSQGIVERYGPQRFPVEVRGERQVDLRIFKIDPLEANFWPFPESGLAVDETLRPAGPGEAPSFMVEMEEHVRQLGSPSLSGMVDLPVDSKAGSGLSLKRHFEQISGAQRPGTYLVGYRQLGASNWRHYIRLQVTDLSLTTIEEESGIVFCVTSLKTGKPILGARVTLESKPERFDERKVLFDGTTNGEGLVFYSHRSAMEMDVFRLVVQSDDDYLVLDPQVPPPQFYDNHWFGTYYTWLSWLRRQPATQKDEPVLKAHVFAERPVHRPEEVVHLKGYIRSIRKGKMTQPAKKDFVLSVEGPGSQQWNYPLTLNAFGSFYCKFDEKDVPTGDFWVLVKEKKSTAVLGSTTFKKESYRIPRFEVRVTGPDRTPLDKAFELVSTAAYYAGGRVVDHEVTWEVTQRPYQFEPPEFPGFVFSSDTRFAEGFAQESSAKVHKTDRTDEHGSSILKIDPTQESDAFPRTYHARVTVRGADEQTVTADKYVQALPPFIVGVKTDRLVTEGKPVRAQIVVLDFDGNLLPEQEIRLKFFHRQWHSYLRESDFTTGEAKYVTEVVDVPVDSRTLLSEKEPVVVDLPVKDAGVYVVEVSGKDRLGRRQKVITDLFVSGDAPVSWEKPEDQVLGTVWDRDRYSPGDEAALILKSPYQKAQALVVVEARDANRYHWVQIRGGKGVFRLGTQATMAPKIPVHVLLMRGRQLRHSAPQTRFRDVGKPTILASTAWLNVEPKPFRLDLRLDHPTTNLPGTSMPLTLTAQDAFGQPINGEATIWLVDRAVLALGKEGPLDPLPSFLKPGKAWIRVRDTRNQAIGYPTNSEHPSGDGLYGESAEGFFDRVTVRKNFKTVPYYNPHVLISGGLAKINIPLPDNLSEFAVRVVVTDGQSRFGVVKSKTAIRLPLIVQSALPRFVRPSDIFHAGGIGRVVEGDGGPGFAELAVDGLSVGCETKRHIDWVANQPEKLFYPLEVDTKSSHDRSAPNHVKVRLGVYRAHDKARDAFEVSLPVRQERAVQTDQFFGLLNPGDTWAVPDPSQTHRPGSLRTKVVVSSHPSLIKVLAGLNYLHAYDHGCLEQRISQTMPILALRDFWQLLGDASTENRDQQKIKETLSALEWALKDNGLYSYWPGSQGKVHLTAYVVDFLLLARDLGIGFDSRYLERGMAALKEALRSDYGYFVSGYKDAERTQALYALAKAGELDPSYALELAARGQQLDLYSEACVLHTFLAYDLQKGPWISEMIEDLWSSVTFAIRDGKQVYEGLQGRQTSWDGPIHSSESRTLGGMLKALILASPEDERVHTLEEALIELGRGDGWGSTQANAAAILALGATIAAKMKDSPPSQVVWVSEKGEQPINPSGKSVALFETHDEMPAQLMLQETQEEPQLAWVQMSYLPEDRGDRAKAVSQGFVVSRRMMVFENEETPPKIEKIRPGSLISIQTGNIVEEHINVVNPEDRHYVAIRVPLAAGLEPLNPNLATAPPQAFPRGKMTRSADYALFEDDRVTFYFDFLPKGTFDFYFRLKASISGSFCQPPVRAEMMYQLTTSGQSAGCRIDIEPRKD